jgi:hypothetical protein
MAKAVIPTTIAARWLTSAKKMPCGESICDTATRIEYPSSVDEY